MKLSPHFTEREMVCKCGCGVWRAHPLLIWALEELRAVLGKPVRINSGYRCQSHNRAIGGAENSLHMAGHAADIAVRGMSGDALLPVAQSIPWLVGFGIGTNYLHVDIGPGRRRVWRY